MAIPKDIAAVFEQVKKQTRAEVEEAGQMTLGAFIAALDEAPSDSWILIDVLGLVPKELDSYRGYYDHLALGFSTDGHQTTAAVLADAKAAMGRCFQGYKGGDYYMNEDTPIWVASYGKSGGLRVVGIGCYDRWVTIKTAPNED
jgi:hypothetical protein